MFSFDRLGMIGHLAHVVNSVVRLIFESSTSQKKKVSIAYRGIFEVNLALILPLKLWTMTDIQLWIVESNC